MTILDARGRYLGTQDEPAPRPAGPWRTNAGRERLAYAIPRSALRGAGVREALAGERTREEREAETVARMTATHPGASWHFVTHPTHGRILVSVPASDEIRAELAHGRRV